MHLATRTCLNCVPREPQLGSSHVSWLQSHRAVQTSHEDSATPVPSTWRLSHLNTLARKSCLNSSDSGAALEYNSDSFYEFDFGLDLTEPESDYTPESSDETLLSGLTQGLVIKLTPTGRFIYWPDQKPEDLVTDGASRFIACLETLPFQEGTPLPATAEENTPTEVISQSSEGYSVDRQVCAVVANGEDIPEASRHRQD